MTSRFTLCALAGALALSLSSAAARADAIGPPPTDCPDGTMGDSCHGGQFCHPVTCMTDSDCTAGQTCQVRPFCIVQINCAGGFVDPDASPGMYDQPGAQGPCATTSDCDAGATCSMENVCVSASASDSGSSSSGSTVISHGCSCATAGGPDAPPAAALLALCAAGAGALARRRDQRASRQRRA